MVGILDNYQAYCFDQAIAYVGNFIKGKLDEVDGKDRKEIEGKQRLVLEKIFGNFVPDEESTPVSAYRDPMDMFNKRKK